MKIFFSCNALTNIWNGDGSFGKWFDANNWSLDLVPTLTHDVIIPGGFTVEIPVAMTGEAKTIQIETNVTFNVFGELMVSP